ncbi:MAG: DMT family transporter [Rhodobacteraceae bacterium]|nr:DMT family transporter [Paracoccaceae bacterium]
MAQAPDITAKSWVMVVLLGLIWGGAFLTIELALPGITPFWLAAARISIGTALTVAAWLGVGVWQGRRARLFTNPAGAADWANTVFIALLSSAAPFMLLSWGQQYVTSGFAGVSMASVALIVLPMAHFLIPGERMTWRRGAGFVIGFAGVVLLIGDQVFASSGAALEFPGRLACLVAAGCYAVSSIQVRRLPAVDPLGLSAVLLAIGAVCVIPVAWIVEGPPPSIDAKTALAVGYLGLVPTAAAGLLRIVLARTAGPVFLSLVNYQVPMWSVLLGALILGEALPPSLIWAMMLILAGVGLSQFGALNRLFSKG